MSPILHGIVCAEMLTASVVQHRVRDCPDCAQGKHGNCDGSGWCTIHDALELCPCAQVDHQ